MAPWAVTATHGDGTNWTLVAILIASSPTRYVHDPSPHLLLQISPQTTESMTMSSPTPPQP